MTAHVTILSLYYQDNDTKNNVMLIITSIEFYREIRDNHFLIFHLSCSNIYTNKNYLPINFLEIFSKFKFIYALPNDTQNSPKNMEVEEYREIFLKKTKSTPESSSERN